MASITTRFSPARTSWPALTATSVSRPGIGESRNLREVRRRLVGHQRQQLGGAAGHDDGVDLGAPVEDAVLQAHPLDLEADRLAVPGAAQEDVAELPVGPQGVGLAVVGDVAAAVDERQVAGGTRWPCIRTTHSVPTRRSWPLSCPVVRTARWM